jgi:hypothetical protein
MNLTQISVEGLTIVSVTERITLVIFDAFPNHGLLVDPEPVKACNNALQFGSIQDLYFRVVCVGHCHSERLLQQNTNPKGELVRVCVERRISVLYVESAVAFEETVCVIPRVSIRDASKLSELPGRVALPFQIYGPSGDPQIIQRPLFVDTFA